jgi:hypothetical protein
MGFDGTITFLITDAVELAPPILVESPNPIVKESQTMESGAMVPSRTPLHTQACRWAQRAKK